MIELLNPFMLLGLIPLFLLYKRFESTSKQTKLLFLAALFSIIALSYPALPQSKSNQSHEVRDFIIALDASFSMQADDIKPNRFEAAKDAIKKLFEQNQKNRFMLFAFTSNALLIAPPTTDARVLSAALDALNPNYILTKSTNLYNLIHTIAKASLKEKNLIIFSDGGDLNAQNIAKVASLIKQNGIKLFFVAVATKKGAALQKDGKLVKHNDTLVVSRLNPYIKELCALTNAHYYELIDLKKLLDDIHDKVETKKSKLQTQSYKELFYYPLAIAILLFFLATTKLYNLLFVMIVVILPQKTDAKLLDFYYISQAQKECKEQKYKACAASFAKVSPSVASRYNEAAALYKAGLYKESLKKFLSIQTTNPKLKQKLLYNIANCYAKLQNYTLAREYYIKALAFGHDKEAYENLLELQKRFLYTKKLPIHKNQNSRKQKRLSLKVQKNSQKAKSGSKKSQNQSGSASSGAGGAKQKSYEAKAKSSQNKQNYKMSYKAYELINKGYINEKEPW